MSVRRWLISIACLGGVWLALCALIGVVAVKAALHPARLSIDQADENAARNIAVRDIATMSEASIVAGDGAILRGWLFTAASGDGDAAILLHGQGDNRAGMLGNADMLLRRGYSVLLPDARAQGDSDGGIAAYGLKESDDLRRWFEWLERNLAPHCIDGLGDSMGAAILLQAVAIEPGFCAVVAESSFASFRDAGYDRLGQAFHTGPWLGRTVLLPAVTAGFVYADIRYGVDFERASPEVAVAGTRVPVLLIHGLADDNLQSRHSERIKAGNPAVMLWEPPNAGHCGAANAEPVEYQRRVVGWFEAHRTRENP
jgi:dipeptidyl aminopeptidase/acylaminoacyl peptidase